MGRRGFKYKTIMDRMITDENGNILFGENPANVHDTINDENQKLMITHLKTQIDNQQTQINKMDTQIQKQDEQISNQETQINHQTTKIENQETMIQRLQTALSNQTEQLSNQGIMIGNQETYITNQENSLANQEDMKANQQTLIDRLEETFDVVVNDNIMQLYGSSTDEKPTDVKIGTTFFEYDTTDVYMFTGSAWVVI